MTKLNGVFQCPEIVRLLQINYLQTLKGQKIKILKNIYDVSLSNKKCS